MTRPQGPGPAMPPCGVPGCPNPHPAVPFTERERDMRERDTPLARRLAHRAPAPPLVPEWRRRLTAKDMTGRVLA